MNKRPVLYVLAGVNGAGTNPEGFLRRIVSIAQAPEGTVVMTSPATLQEAVDSLVVHAKLNVPDLTTEGPAPSSLAGSLESKLATRRTTSAFSLEAVRTRRWLASPWRWAMSPKPQLSLSSFWS